MEAVTPSTGSCDAPQLELMSRWPAHGSHQRMQPTPPSELLCLMTLMTLAQQQLGPDKRQINPSVGVQV